MSCRPAAVLRHRRAKSGSPKQKRRRRFRRRVMEAFWLYRGLRYTMEAT